jgi:mRNA-degrading endonuclease toxin of MazEF toxin-antitoxin module
MTPVETRLPSRGEIWWTNLPTDPPEKGKRPVIVVSPDGRNHHPRSNSVLVVPLSTSVQLLRPAHLLLRMGETGLPADSAAQTDNITTVRREGLSEPRPQQRKLSHSKVCELAALVRTAMGCF